MHQKAAFFLEVVVTQLFNVDSSVLILDKKKLKKQFENSPFSLLPLDFNTVE